MKDKRSLCLAVTSLCHVIQAKGMLEVKRLAVELRGWFASTRSTFQHSNRSSGEIRHFYMRQTEKPLNVRAPDAGEDSMLRRVHPKMRQTEKPLNDFVTFRILSTFYVSCFSRAWRWREKTHAPSPSTSGKTHERPSVIQTRNEEVSRPLESYSKWRWTWT